MAIDYIITIQGTHHIPLYNYDNHFCYWNSVIQRLHSSPTLNANLIQIETTINQTNTVEYIMLKPVLIYAQLEQTKLSNDEIISTYRKIINYMNATIPNLVHQNGQNGYIPHYLLNFIYCPIIYALFPNDFINIMNEIHISKNEFDVSKNVVKDTLTTGNPFFANSTMTKRIIQLFDDMSDYMGKELRDVQFSLEPFTTAIFEIFPNKDQTGGHAITLIRGYSNLEPTNIDYFLIDDQRAIDTFANYYKHREDRIYEISIKDIDEITANDLNRILREDVGLTDIKFSKRITRYSMNFEHNFLTSTDDILKEELRRVEQIHTNNVPTYQSMTTQPQTTTQPIEKRITTTEPNRSKVIQYFIFGLFVGVIVGILVAVVAIHRKYGSASIKPQHER